MAHTESEEELRDAGLLALRHALGAERALRFIRLYEPGAGDYTRDRVLYIGDPTLEELLENIRERELSTALPKSSETVSAA